MRVISNPPKPSTNTLKSIPLNTGYNSRNYPELVRGTFDNYTADVVELTPEAGGSGKDYTRINFELGTESRELKISDTWTLDLTETTIDLTTFTAGIIDGISRENGRNYLIWVFLDSTLNFSGIGLTRKPYSAFTSAANYLQGDVGTFAVTNGYQFVIGSRVCVRNQNGTAPLYEWNWGTVATIANTSITVNLDNKTYGTTINITAANGEILQWDKFRPNVVTTTEQTLYQPYYSLFGDIETALVDGSLLPAYRKDEEFRIYDPTSNGLFHNGTTPLTNVTISLARIIPLWSKKINILGLHRTSNINNTFQVKTSTAIEQYQAVTQVANQYVQHHGMISLNISANVTLSFPALTILNNQIFIIGYSTPGGMRL